MRRSEVHCSAMSPPSETSDTFSRAAVPRVAVPAFLDVLDAALGHLVGLLDVPLGFGRAVRTVDRLRATLACVRYLHAWPERFTLESSFTVSVVDPGFPSFKDVWMVEEDRTHAAEKLAVLPAVERITESAVRDVRAGRFPLVWQRALVQRRYYERLLRTEVVNGFEVGTPRLGTGSKERPLHALDWSGLDADDTRFVYQSLEFSTDPSMKPPSTVEPSGDLYKTLRSRFRDPLTTQFDHLETLADVNPRVLSRLRVGPFHANLASPRPGIAGLGGDPQAWLLECTVERLERGSLREPGGAEDTTARSTVLLCPRGVQERLGGRGSDGQPARVFGVTETGEVKE